MVLQVIFWAEVDLLNSVMFNACKELIDDVKEGSTDLVFKEICLDILARAKNVLDNKEFKALLDYASERMLEKAVISVDAIR